MIDQTFVNKRALVKITGANGVKEAWIAEFSPSGKYVNLGFGNDWQPVDQITVVEELPEVKYPPLTNAGLVKEPEPAPQPAEAGEGVKTGGAAAAVIIALLLLLMLGVFGAGATEPAWVAVNIPTALANASNVTATATSATPTKLNFDDLASSGLTLRITLTTTNGGTSNVISGWSISSNRSNFTPASLLWTNAAPSSNTVTYQTNITAANLRGVRAIRYDSTSTTQTNTVAISAEASWDH